MANIINITERGNRLDITDTYTPIVCGNSNYELHFDFSDEWSECNKKTAVFFVNGKKTAVEFEGDAVEVPILPNAPFVYVALITSNNSNKQLASTQLRLRLESTPLLDETKEFNPLQHYLASLLGTINNIESGNLTVKKSEIAENVVNANFLINGDFRVNQRGEGVYNLTGTKYTVDRWLGFSGLEVSVVSNGGVIVENTNSSGGGWFQQKFEENFEVFKDKTITISAKVGGKLYSGTATIPESEPAVQTNIIDVLLEDNNHLRLTYLTNGQIVFNFYVNAGTTLEIEYAKLEFATSATAFELRPYAEELAKCQRYYQKITGSSTYQAIGTGLATTTTRGDILIPTPVYLRTKPTLTTNGSFRIYFGSSSTTNNNFSIANDGYSTNGMYVSCNLTATTYAVGSALLLRVEESGANISLDAEIY